MRALLVLVSFLAPVVLAATNFNLSRSNLYRVVYPQGLTSAGQVKSMLADLDKTSLTDEAKLKHWLAANFKRYGIDPALVKKVIVEPPSKDVKERPILILTNPSDERAARRVLLQQG